MDVNVAALLAVRQLDTQSEVSTRVLRKVLDIQQNQAEALVALVDQGQGLGQNLNLSA